MSTNRYNINKASSFWEFIQLDFYITNVVILFIYLFYCFINIINFFYYSIYIFFYFRIISIIDVKFNYFYFIKDN